MNSKPLIVANWKATKTIKETIEWVNKVKPELVKIDYADMVICPPFTSLPILASLFEKSNVKIGAQDVSKFTKGAFTGEVNVEMLDGLASYCIVGHSERRKYLGESDDDVISKVKLLLGSKITPVLCVSDLDQMDSYLDRGKEIIEAADDIIFVYEPPGAISVGGVYRPEEPEIADEKVGKISEKVGRRVRTLYGGSINPENAPFFFTQKNIDGGLVGQASTDPAVFAKLLASIRINTSGE
ncbi:MAG: hypothetical protein A2Z11_00170 [Candidatus Woykebacteria bacterium RBG_16_43_9]|uniref:Triosephosphate isomerase n=1 Tax=Candidatus Woykebacteria bacterium RBG_16_43_9 TaxID=1802596 RepID=A0A1G1WFU7_9BACT|nr:MAG: hypothetical protein A2Z11_00170 [Candidatus Woykebacteria bacterium RBG_16_43_9]